MAEAQSELFGGNGQQATASYWADAGLGKSTSSGRKRTIAAASLPTPPGTEDLVLHEPSEGDIHLKKRPRIDDATQHARLSFNGASSRFKASPCRIEPSAGAEGNHELQEEAKDAASCSENPFLAGPDDRRKPRHRDPRGAKITYVFRGKRIQYDAPEDIVLPGESPFVDSVPRLLFPARSPSPCPSNSTCPLSTPSGSRTTPMRADNDADPFALASKQLVAGLPTPRSHRKKRHA